MEFLSQFGQRDQLCHNLSKNLLDATNDEEQDDEEMEMEPEDYESDDEDEK